MSDKRWHLIAYDMRDPKRYRRVHRVLLSYGEPVQYSIFRCHLTPVKLEALRLALARWMAPEDRLLVIPLCERCRHRLVEEGPDTCFDHPEERFEIL
jgi:CRISPR-associated protein Cas2